MTEVLNVEKYIENFIESKTPNVWLCLSLGDYVVSATEYIFLYIKDFSAYRAFVIHCYFYGEENGACCPHVEENGACCPNVEVDECLDYSKDEALYYASKTIKFYYRNRGVDCCYFVCAATMSDAVKILEKDELCGVGFSIESLEKERREQHSLWKHEQEKSVKEFEKRRANMEFYANSISKKIYDARKRENKERLNTL